MFNITSSIPFHKDLPDSTRKVRVRVEDDHDLKHTLKLLKFLPGLVAQMDEVLATGKGVLVHCKHARQRAPAVIAAYLMHKDSSLDVEEAIDFVQTMQPTAFTKDVSFRLVLEQWYDELHLVGGEQL